MNTNDEVTNRQTDDRRDFLKAAAKGLVAISVAAAGSAAFVIAAPYVPELSNGADNFYRSNVVDVQRVSFHATKARSLRFPLQHVSHGCDPTATSSLYRSER